MKAPKLERQLKEKLAGAGIEIKPGTPAARALKQIARASAEVVESGEDALRVARKTFDEVAEAAREKIHDATAPRPPRPSSRRASSKSTARPRRR